jgi:hypothetical protein
MHEQSQNQPDKADRFANYGRRTGHRVQMYHLWVTWSRRKRSGTIRNTQRSGQGSRRSSLGCFLSLDLIPSLWPQHLQIDQTEACSDRCSRPRPNHSTVRFLTMGCVHLQVQSRKPRIIKCLGLNPKLQTRYREIIFCNENLAGASSIRNGCRIH